MHPYFLHSSVGSHRRAAAPSRLLAALVLLLLTLLSGARATQAAITSSWITASGTFNVGTNWSTNPTVPGSADTAQFNTAGIHTVTISNNPTNAALTVSAGNVRFITNGPLHSYTITGTTTVSSAILSLNSSPAELPFTTRGLSVHSDATFNINAGNDVSVGADGLGIGSAAAGTAGMTVDGNSSTLTVSSATGLGLAGVGNLTLSNGAQGAFSHLSLGISATSGAGGNLSVQGGADVAASGNIALATTPTSGVSATIEVTGAGSTFSQTGAFLLTVGASDSTVASLTVADNGVFSTAAGQTSVNPTGFIDIAGGTFNANGNVLLNGGKLQRSAGAFNLATNRMLTAQNNALINFNGSYNIANATTFTIQSGARFFTTLNLDVGNGSNGTLIVDGEGSVLSTNSVPFWGANGGTGFVTLRNGATATLFFNLQVGALSAPGTTGMLNLFSGATMSVGNLYIALSGANGTVSLTNPGSAITQNSGALLVVGHASLGSGTLNINSGSTFNTGTGLTTVNATGLININGGIFNVGGDFLLNGGTLQTSGLFKLAPGKNFSAQNNAQVSFIGGHAVGNGSSFTIESGADIASTALLSVGSNSNGTLIVDGPGSTLTIAGTSSWGAGGNAGTVTLRNGATANINASLIIAQGNTPGTTGTLNVQTGATMTVGTLSLANAGATGTITLTHPNSAITQTGASSLTIGHASAGSATLNINNNATFNTGTGLITVNATGTLALNGGTFHAYGTLRFNAGSTLLFHAGEALVPGTGKLDLHSSAAIFQAIDPDDKADLVAALRDWINSGSNGGTWTGPGITSTTAAANSTNYGVALFDNALLQKTTFGNQPVDQNSLLLSIARLGDTNLDAIVDINDLGNLANNWQQPGDTWDEGDFNMDGFVDINDLGILASNWQQTSQFPLLPNTQFPFPNTQLTPIPEPASLLLFLSSFCVIARRTRKSPGSHDSVK